MNCYFCKKYCSDNGALFICNNHEQLVYHGENPYIVFFYGSTNIVIYIYPNDN